MTHQLISLASEQSFQCLAITSQVRSFLRQHGGREGAVVVSSQHTTTAVIINEMEERLLLDIEHWLTQIAPAAAPWKHNDLHLRPNIPADEPRNAHAHLQALLLGNQVIVNVSKGELVLGTYQDVILVELDGPRQRQVSLQWLSS
jgi:secondary thiamine-phosphate synthase enzyme